MSLRAVLVAIVGALAAVAAPAEEEQGRFLTVEVHVDAGSTPLAAWQIEIDERGGGMTVVGIEGGEHPAFAEPAHYDRPAVERGEVGRLVLAAFSLASELPAGRTRVATLHVRTTRSGTPELEARLIAAGGRDGRSIPADVELTTR